MILTGQRLAEIGQRLYGEGWRTTMARRLNRTKKTLFRWERGSRIPKPVRLQLMALVDEQIAALNEMREAMETAKRRG